MNDIEMTPEQKKYQPLFDLVAPKDNWKKRIDALVDPAELSRLGVTENDLCHAVTFYTGSVPTISRERGSIRVRAAGYYAAIGA